MLEQVRKLREEGKYEEAKSLMVRLVEQEPERAVYQYQMAWCYDNLGLEQEAVPHYERAIQLGLPAEDLENAYLGLGSTYRTLGRYEEAVNTFEAAITKFPKAAQLKAFYSMSLYNLGKHHQAMEILLQALAHTTSDEKILSYKKAILFYSDKLDEVW